MNNNNNNSNTSKSSLSSPPPPKKVLIVGAGAGGLVAGYHLSLAGAQVVFYVRPNRMEELQKSQQQQQQQQQQQPIRLYCYDDLTIREFHNYRLICTIEEFIKESTSTLEFTSTSNEQQQQSGQDHGRGRPFDYILLALDGASIQTSEGQALLKSLGDAIQTIENKQQTNKNNDIESTTTETTTTTTATATTKKNVIISCICTCKTGGDDAWIQQITGLPNNDDDDDDDDRIVCGAFTFTAHQTETTTKSPIPFFASSASDNSSSSVVNPEEFKKARIAYRHVNSKKGMMIDSQKTKKSYIHAKAFATLYNQSMESTCDMVSSTSLGLIAIVFPLLAALELDGWPKTEELLSTKSTSTSSTTSSNKNKNNNNSNNNDNKEHVDQKPIQYWSLGCRAANEIASLPEYYNTNFLNKWMITKLMSIFMTPWVYGKIWQWMKTNCHPLDWDAFNQYHHGTKVRFQNRQILKDKWIQGTLKDGILMPNLEELIQKLDELDNKPAPFPPYPLSPLPPSPPYPLVA